MSERIPLRTINDPIHTRSYQGRYRNFRLLGSGLLFVLYFGTAWLNWNGHQAVLFDLENHRFHIFGATFWPQDFILLATLLIICAFGLFLMTVFAGRMWCGYTCPQSIWTWVFMRVEQITEGERSQRIKLATAPWSVQKLWRRAAKHTLWLTVSLMTALAFVGYFTPIRPLITDLITLNLGATTAFWLLFFTLATYINAGWLREKVCRDMCPYSRFQSVMFDRDTLIIAYDSARGENRGARHKADDYRAMGLGDCVDCTMCVQVCPTGIDIRNGLQLECISCGACIDACDTVMDKLGYPRGLVRYSSQAALQGGQTRWLRPRLVGYAAMLLMMIGSFAWELAHRPLLALDVARDRGMYRENSAGQMENIYNLKITNKTQQPRTYNVTLVDSAPFKLHDLAPQHLAAGEVRELPISVALVDSHDAKAVYSLYFAMTDNSAPERQITTKSVFLAPGR